MAADVRPELRPGRSLVHLLASPGSYPCPTTSATGPAPGCVVCAVRSGRCTALVRRPPMRGALPRTRTQAWWLRRAGAG